MLVGLSISLMLAIVGKGVDNNLSIWLGNVLVASMFTLLAVGLLNFLQKRINPLLVCSPIFLIALALFVLFDQLSAQIIVGGLIHFFQVVILLWIISYYRAQLVGRGKMILAACFTFSIPVSLSRPIASFLGYGRIENFNSTGVLQAYTFLAITVVSIITVLALVLMQ